MNFFQTILGAVISASFFPTLSLIFSQISDRKLSRAVKMYNELDTKPELSASRAQLRQYIEHETLQVFQFGSSKHKWLTRFIRPLQGLAASSVVFFTLAFANAADHQLLWFGSLLASSLLFAWLFAWNPKDDKSPQLRDTEQELVDVGSETPSLSKSPEQTSNEDVDR